MSAPTLKAITAARLAWSRTSSSESPTTCKDSRCAASALKKRWATPSNDSALTTATMYSRASIVRNTTDPSESPRPHVLSTGYIARAMPTLAPAAMS